MNNKTADEMFEELGCKPKENQLNQLQYINENDTVIAFNLDYKTVAVYNYYDGFEYIEMQELQAINKKCEEMGWI